MFAIILLLQYFSSVYCAGMTSHNIVAKRAAQFEYFGPASSEFNVSSFYGLSEDRYDAVQAGMYLIFIIIIKSIYNYLLLYNYY